MAWYVDEIESEVLIVIRGQTSGWVGIGWGNQANMRNADMIVSSVDQATNVTTMTDRNTFGEVVNSKPPSDGTSNQNFVLLWGYFQGGSSYFSFKRPFVTGDTAGDLDILGTVYMLWALGGDGDIIVNDNFNQHPIPGTVVSITWNATTTPQQVNTARNFSLIAVHAGLEIFGLAFLLVLGHAIPAALKKALGGKKIWLPLHIVAQLAGTSLMFAGLGLAIAFLDDDPTGTEPDKTGHDIVAYITLALVGLAVIFGTTKAFLKKDGVSKNTNKIIEWIHAGLGYLTIILGFVSIWLGMDSLNDQAESTGTPTASWVLYSIWAGISIALALALFFIKKKLPKPALLGIWVFWIVLGLGLLLPTAILIGDTRSSYR